MASEAEVTNSTRLGRVVAGVGVFVVAMLMGAGAFAQDLPEFDVQTFHPAAGPYSIFTLDTSPVLGHMEPSGAVVLNYASEPLVLQPSGGDETTPFVDQQLAMHVLAGIGLFDIGELDVELPVYFVNDSGFSNTPVEGGVIGDIALRPKVAILSREDFPVGLTGALDVTLPTGKQEALVGSKSVTAAPRVIADYRVANVTLATNLGVRIMQDSTIRNVQVGDSLEYGFGAEAEFLHGLLRLGGEIYGNTELSNFFGNADESPLEGILGAKVVTHSGLSVMAGAGGGLVGGVGAPEFRGFVGLRYSLTETDADGDTIRDAEDKCPRKAEDLDGFQDEDGCPDPDNDDDGVPDVEDRCAQEAGPADNDGCPVEDKKQDKQEQDKQEQDKQEQDKQAAPDADKDGIADADDLCPEQAEDKDGFEDDDGCPDADNDRDGVLDAADKCPQKPGLADDEGCPPATKLAERDGKRIKLMSPVAFEAGKAKLDPKASAVLDQVALILRTSPDIAKVEIGAHTDEKGGAKVSQKLSDERAKAVETYLVEQAKVPADKLVAKGYGETQPIIASELEQARAKNRRIEFTIIEPAKADTSKPAGDVEKADEK